jgi:hypothetical protein
MERSMSRNPSLEAGSPRSDQDWEAPVNKAYTLTDVLTKVMYFALTGAVVTFVLLLLLTQTHP